MPSYDTSLEVPFSQQYLERRNKCIRELEMRDLKIKISTFLYDILLSPITGLLLAVALIAADIITNTKKERVD